jgi:hypothetical protein
MSEDEIHPRSSRDKKGISANVPIVLTVLSAIMTAVIGGYVAWTTKGMETREQRRITEIQTGSQKSIAEMQKDAQQAIAQDTLKGQLAIADKQGQAQKDVAGTQRETERYMADARTRADREIASLAERTKNQLGNQQDSVERAKLFSGLVNELADTSAHKSSVALLVLWQLYQSDADRSVIIATALAVENDQIVETLKMLGVRDQRSLELIKYYGKQGTPQQKATARAVLGAIKVTCRGSVGTTEQNERVEGQVRLFQQYLNNLGFPDVAEDVTVCITVEDNAYYEPGQMTLGKNIVGDQNAVLREYAHHVLRNISPTIDPDQYGLGVLAIESGMATYLACSHTENSVSRWTFTGGAVTVDLNNNDKAETPTQYNVSTMGASVWGGLFWQIRTSLGKSAADRLIFQTVRSIKKVRGGTGIQAYRDFANQLLQTDRSIDGQTNQQRIRSIVEGRGLTL